MWKDCSSFSASDTKRVPSIFKLKVQDLDITVHRHIHYAKDQWLLSCTPFFDKKPISTGSSDEACKIAIELLTSVISIHSDLLNSLRG